MMLASSIFTCSRMHECLSVAQTSGPAPRPGRRTHPATLPSWASSAEARVNPVPDLAVKPQPLSSIPETLAPSLKHKRFDTGLRTHAYCTEDAREVYVLKYKPETLGKNEMSSHSIPGYSWCHPRYSSRFARVAALLALISSPVPLPRNPSSCCLFSCGCNPRAAGLE